jgi:hypothetical protein
MYLLRFSSQGVMEELLVKPGLSVFYPKVDRAAMQLRPRVQFLLTWLAEPGVPREKRRTVSEGKRPKALRCSARPHASCCRDQMRPTRMMKRLASMSR